MEKLENTEVTFWLNEIQSCLKRRDEELIKRNNYPHLIKYYEGEQGSSGKKLAIINEYFPSVNGMIAEIMYKNPTVITQATKPQAEEGVPTMNGALTYAMDRTDSLTENKLGLFDMIMAGYCGIEVNYIQKGATQSQPEGETQGIMGKVKSMFKKPENDEQAEENLEKSLPVKEKAYAEYHNTYIRRWNPLNIILDYRAERLKDMRYVGKIIKMTHAEFSARYPKFKDKVQAGDSLEYCMQDKDEDKKLVTLYELQIKKEDGRYVNLLISPSYKFGEIDYWERPYTTNGFNLKIGVLHEYGKLYPISVAQINKSIQDDINNYATFWMETAERNVPKRGYNRNKVKDDAIVKLNSSNVNEAVPVDGGSDSIWTIPNTNVSNENKELYAIFQQQKEKLWSQSQSRMQGKADVRFAEEIKQQEAGFMARQSDIQDGLRKLYRSELDTVKDIIATYWDDEVFFKITGKGKPDWYIPQVGINPVTGAKVVLNPLAELLSADYMVDVDISSSLKPNKDKIKRDLIEYLSWLMDPIRLEWLAQQGKTISMEAIAKTAKQFDMNPESLFMDLPPVPEPPMPPIELGEDESVEEEEQVRKDEMGNEQNVKITRKQKRKVFEPVEPPQGQADANLPVSM